MLKRQGGDSKVLLLVLLALVLVMVYGASEFINLKREQAEKRLRLKLVITENRINISRLAEINEKQKKPAKVILRTRHLAAFAGEAEEYYKKYENLKSSWEATREQFIKYGILKPAAVDEANVDAKQAEGLIVLYNGFTGMISSVDSSGYGIVY